MIFLFACIAACESKSELSENMNCKPEQYANLETIADMDKQFKVLLPSHWKTHLYYDKNQTSIFSADTTKQLTDSYTIDITYVYDEIIFDDQFIQRFKKNLSDNLLVETTSYELMFKERDAYYSRAIGKRGKFKYQICNLFIKIYSHHYLHAKAEIFGDSLVNQRICNALSLIEKIEY